MYYCNPLNIEYKFQFVKRQRPGMTSDKFSIYREAADPSLILFKGLYYLFPSMTTGFFTSENLIDWLFHPLGNEVPVYDYAPDVRQVGDYLYFSASKRSENCSFFRSKDPVNEPFEEVAGAFPFWDPNLFQDDDGRVYFYWGCTNTDPIYGVEIDPATMKPLGKPLAMFDSDMANRGYERIGDDHISPKTQEQIKAQAEALISQMEQAPLESRQAMGLNTHEDLKRFAYAVMGDNPYIEGAWLTKYSGKYYLQYAIPGTQYNIYGDGVYVAEAPLGPYHPAKNNPFSYQPGGFITGAGHGSTLEDASGRIWHTATMRISHTHEFERRLGLWKAGFDSDGGLYCDQRYGDWPINAAALAFAKPDWMLLSYGKPVQVSSGTGAEHVTDEDIRTWWRAASNQPGEWLTVDLGQIADVKAIQVNFAEDNIQAEPPQYEMPNDLTYEVRYIDRVAQKTRWLLEGSLDGQGYYVIEDKSAAKTDLSHDFLVCESGIQARYLRLTVHELPYAQTPCVSGLRVFGLVSGAAPAKAADVTVRLDGDLDMTVSWQAPDAVGSNVLWGYAPDKLYHSYLVYGKCEQHIGALIKGEPLYIRVDTFNEAGITEGEVIEIHK